MQKKNLLLISSSMIIGGAEVVIANLIRNLNKDKFNITICELKKRGVIGYELEKEGYEVIKIEDSKFFRNNYFSFLKIKKIIKQKKIDIIHSHNTEPFFESAISKLITPKVKFIHTYHYGNYPRLPKIDITMEKLFWKSSDQLVACGIEQREIIKKLYNIPDDRIMTIWNGVEAVRAGEVHPVIHELKKSGKIIIGSISSMTEQKGIQYLLETAQILKNKGLDFTILVVGDGILKDGLEAQCRNMELTNVVTFTGWVENAASRILPHIDIFIQTSLWEAMSMVVIEAMAAEKPVVVTRVGDNMHVVDDMKNGLLVEPRNSNEMAEKLEKLMASPELRAKLASKAKKDYHEKFTVKNMIENYEKLYLSFS